LRLWHAHAAAGRLAFAKSNHVNHDLTNQSSILGFIEDNWLFRERVQPGGSFDTIAGSIGSMFDFHNDRDDQERKLILDEKTGKVVLSTFHDDDDDQITTRRRCVLRCGGLR
jgi:hypothetical protein